MPDERPTVYLLSGLPGSGKSTYARRLERAGVVRIAVDAEMIERHGRIGVDYPGDAHGRLLAPVLDWAQERLTVGVRSGASVVLDHGLGNRSDRDEWKRIVDAAGGTWRLLAFREEIDTLIERLADRGASDRTDSLPITPAMLRHLATVYDAPIGEGEEPAP